MGTELSDRTPRTAITLGLSFLMLAMLAGCTSKPKRGISTKSAQREAAKGEGEKQKVLRIDQDEDWEEDEDAEHEHEHEDEHGHQLEPHRIADAQLAAG